MKLVYSGAEMASFDSLEQGCGNRGHRSTIASKSPLFLNYQSRGVDFLSKSFRTYALEECIEKLSRFEEILSNFELLVMKIDFDNEVKNWFIQTKKSSFLNQIDEIKKSIPNEKKFLKLKQSEKDALMGLLVRTNNYLVQEIFKFLSITSAAIVCIQVKQLYEVWVKIKEASSLLKINNECNEKSEQHVQKLKNMSEETKKMLEDFFQRQDEQTFLRIKTLNGILRHLYFEVFHEYKSLVNTISNSQESKQFSNSHVCRSAIGGILGAIFAGKAIFAATVVKIGGIWKTGKNLNDLFDNDSFEISVNSDTFNCFEGKNQFMFEFENWQQHAKKYEEQFQEVRKIKQEVKQVFNLQFQQFGLKI